MAAVIKTVNLTKRYGTLVALSNLNLEIAEGDCFGFIGPNGAGKTTTIKILATLLQPTWGEARICDHVVGYQSRQIRPLIGYVPDYFGAYEDMVVQEYMEFFAAAYNINGPARSKVVSDVLELTDLAYKKDAAVDGLSRGMKQRLSIARVLVHDPKVLLLDEPAGNLDPRARIEMRELLKELRRMGKTILISSHILPELADLCNTVGIIERGELIYSGPVADIVKRAKAGMILHVGVAHNQELAAALLSQDPNVVNVAASNGHLEVSLKDGINDYTFIPQRLVQNGFKLTLLKEEEVNLETAFMRLTKGMVQ
ncbi:MAG: type transport system ATP-binding protein [Phycisphaerales bacterium]|jgi:ABC-2 type transport system ATP-binding protein|nr:type transport system ATP-binding protein [Phycisphaerales bacterium]MEA2736356.1 type transport system ATP-binding protein [Humisphaera sp.]